MSLGKEKAIHIVATMVGIKLWEFGLRNWSA